MNITSQEIEDNSFEDNSFTNSQQCKGKDKKKRGSKKHAEGNPNEYEEVYDNSNKTIVKCKHLKCGKEFGRHTETFIRKHDCLI